MATLRKIMYGAPTDKSADTVRLGVKMGFFEQEDLDLSVEVVFGGPQIAAAYASGELQIGEIGSPPGDKRNRGRKPIQDRGQRHPPARPHVLRGPQRHPESSTS